MVEEAFSHPKKRLGPPPKDHPRGLPGQGVVLAATLIWLSWPTGHARVVHLDQNSCAPAQQPGFALHAGGNLRSRHKPGDETPPVLRPQGLCHGGPPAGDPHRVAPLASAMQRTTLQVRGTSCCAMVKEANREHAARSVLRAEAAHIAHCRARVLPAANTPCEVRSATRVIDLTRLPRTS
jgi:hypothetical protein